MNTYISTVSPIYRNPTSAVSAEVYKSVVHIPRVMAEKDTNIWTGHVRVAFDLSAEIIVILTLMERLSEIISTRNTAEMSE